MKDIEKIKLKDCLCPEMETHAWGLLYSKFGADVKISYKDGKAHLGRTLHLDKPAIRGVLHSCHNKGMLRLGRRGFVLNLPDNGGSKDG